jgi:hypothetical protein
MHPKLQRQGAVTKNMHNSFYSIPIPTLITTIISQLHTSLLFVSHLFLFAMNYEPNKTPQPHAFNRCVF